MAKQLFCRHCFELFRADRIMVLCRSERCSGVPDDRGRRGPRFIDPRAHAALWRRFRRRLVLDAPCPFCQEIDVLAPACPLCRGQLEEGLGEAVVDRVIAVIGARDSGKSHYLATVLHQLLEGGAGGEVWEPAMKAEDVALYRRHFRRPLFDQRQELPATPPAPGPELRLTLEGRGGKTLVVFRDLGGEVFDDPERLKDLGFLRYAPGVVLMVDPFAFPPPAGSPLAWAPNGEPTCTEVLERYRAVLEALPRYPEHRALPLLPRQKALAVVLTKADLLLDEDHRFWDGAAGRPHLAKGFWHDRRTDSEAVRGWLRGRLGLDLADAAGAFGEVGYFVVSSYGYPPHQPRSRLDNPPRPRRVHEPIFALLDLLAEDEQGGGAAPDVDPEDDIL